MLNRNPLKWPTKAVLRATKKKAILIFLINLMFVSGTLWLMFGGSPDWEIWACLIFFFICLCISVYSLLKTDCLILTHEGFTNSYLGMTKTFRWEEVSEFMPLKIQPGLFSSVNQVIFETYKISPKPMAHKNVQKTMQIIGGGYRLNVDDLAKALNTYREDAIANLPRNRRVS